MLLVILSLTSCQETKTKKAGAKGPSAKQATKAKPKSIEDLRGQSGFVKPSQATDLFFRTFFSGNIEGAYRMTTTAFRINNPYEKIEPQWSAFYAEASKHGLNRKMLSYRSDFRAEDGDNGGIVFSPSGRMVMRIYCRRLITQSGITYAIDQVVIFRKSLAINKGNGKERTVITNLPEDANYRAIFDLLVKSSSSDKKEPSNSVVINKLIVSDGWARVIFTYSPEKSISKQFVLQKIKDKWTIVDEKNTQPTYNEYPDSPYMLWAADDWK